MLPLAAGAQNLPPMPKTEVMVLGTYHMDNPGLDMVKAPLDDHLSPSRQKQIQEVVDRLARFRPTKILLEADFGGEEMNSRLTRFRNGTYKLSADERDQLGIRLAQRLNHERLYSVDFKHDMDIQAVFALAQKQGDKKMLETMGVGMKEVQKLVNRLPHQTVRQSLIEDNSAKMDAFTQGMYNLLLRVNEEPSNYKGVEVVSGWYHRNLRIFANIAKTISPKDERVLVIMGGGHGPILRQLVREAPDMKLVDAAKYLR